MNKKIIRHNIFTSNKVESASNDFQKGNNSKGEKKTEFLEKVKNNILSDRSKGSQSVVSALNINNNEHFRSKRKFYSSALKKNELTGMKAYEPTYDANKKPSFKRNLSIDGHSSLSKNSKDNEKGHIVREVETTNLEKMNNYDTYKNNFNTEEYLNNLKEKNMFFLNEEKKKEEENEKAFIFGNINYQNDDRHKNESLFKGNIRHNSEISNEFVKNNNDLNKMEMNLLYNNKLEKINANLTCFDEGNKRREINDTYKNNYFFNKKYNNFNGIQERENYQLNNPEVVPSNNPSFFSNNTNANKNSNVNENNNVMYNDNALKPDLRANFINDVINEAARKNVYGEKMQQADNTSDTIARLNFNNKGSENNSVLNDLAIKKKHLENLMNLNTNKNEEIKRNVGGGYDNLNDINKYFDTFYSNYNKTNVDLNNKIEGRRNDINNDDINAKNPYWGHRDIAHKRSSSSNINLKKTEIDKLYNYSKYADDGEAQLKYFREKGTSHVSAFDKYLQMKRNEEERIAKQQMNELNMDNLKNKNNFEEVIGSNAINRNVIGGMPTQNNMENNNIKEGKNEMEKISDFDINEIRKKHMKLNSMAYNDINEKEKNLINKKENYLENGNEMYSANGINEKEKLPGLISNYEDLMSYDKNLRKKGELKNIVCVCQASKQMARLQIHMEENRHMLETEKNLMKKRKDNFEKKVEMLAEKEKEIEKIHLQTKEKEMNIEKKKNEIEEKERYVNAIKSKYDNAQKELLEKMNECITIENKCKSKLYEYDDKFGQFNKKIKEMEEREKEIEEERRHMERREKMLNNNKQELEEEKLALLKEKTELGVLKRDLETFEKEKKKMIENEYRNLHSKEEEVRRNERNILLKEKELENRIDQYNNLIDELNKSKKEFEKEKMKSLSDLQEERLKLLNKQKQIQVDLEHEKNNLRVKNENEKNMMEEELKKERASLMDNIERMKQTMLKEVENTKNLMMENIEKEKIKGKEELEKEKSVLHKNMEEERRKMDEDNEKLKNAIEQRYKDNYENDKYRLENKYDETLQKLKIEYENKTNDLRNDIENEQLKINKEKEIFEQQKQMYEEEFRRKCEQYEESIKKKYDILEEDKNKMKYLIMKEQEELENYKKGVYLDIEEEKEKLYVLEKKLNLEKENLLVEKEQIEIDLKNYKNFKEKEENDIKIRIINLSQQQEDLNKEKENLEKEKEELEKKRIALDEKEECLNNDKNQIEESRQIFDQQLENIKKNKEELLNYDKELQKREIHLIEKEKEHNKREEELNKKQDSLNIFDNELKEYSEKLQGREKKLKEKKNELQKVKDQLMNFKNSIKQKETQLQMIEVREKELLDEQTLIQIDRNSLEAEKKQFFLLKEKQQKDTDFIQEQLKLLHDQLKNKEKSLKEKENEINLLNKLQDCRNKSGKGNIISLKNPDNPRMLSANIPRGSTVASRNKVKVKVIGKNKFDLMKRRNRKKSINFNYNNLDINNSIQYIDNMINENFKNKGRLKYQSDTLELSDANFLEEKNTNERQYPPRASILMNNVIDSDLITDKIAKLKETSEQINDSGTKSKIDNLNTEKETIMMEEEKINRHNQGNTKKIDSKGTKNNDNNNSDSKDTRLYEKNMKKDIHNKMNGNNEEHYNYNEERKENMPFLRNASRSEFFEDTTYRNMYEGNFEKDFYAYDDSNYNVNNKNMLVNKNANYMDREYNEKRLNAKDKKNNRNNEIHSYHYENGDTRENNANSNTINNANKNANERNYRTENELNKENDTNSKCTGGMEKTSGKRQNEKYLDKKNSSNSDMHNNNNYNTNNLRTNIKAESSSYNDASSVKNNNVMSFNDKKEQQQRKQHLQYQQVNNNALIMSMNMKDLENSDITNKEKNYRHKESVRDDENVRTGKINNFDEQKSQRSNVNNNETTMPVERKKNFMEIAEKGNYSSYKGENMNYHNNNEQEKSSLKNFMGENKNTLDNKITGSDTNSRNMKTFKNENIPTTDETRMRENPLNTIDSLVNQNMQSINNLSFLMVQNTKPKNKNIANIANKKGTITDIHNDNEIKELNSIRNNYKNMPFKNMQKNENVKMYNEERLKKESNSNEFLEDINSENYYKNTTNNNYNIRSATAAAAAAETTEENDTFFYNEDSKKRDISNNDSSSRFVDSYDYNYNDGYEKDVKREEGGIQYMESNSNIIDTNFHNNRYDSNQYGGGIYDHVNTCYNKTNVYNNSNKYGNIRIMQDSGYNSDSNVFIYHGYAQDEKNKKIDYQQGGNAYKNENITETKNNSSNVYLNNANSSAPKNKTLVSADRNTEVMSENMPMQKDNEVNVYNKKKMPLQSNKERSSNKLNRLPLIRNKNATLSNAKGFPLESHNNTDANSSSKNLNKKLQSKMMEQNLNKNMNVARMKSFSDNAQKTNHSNGNLNKGNAISNSIIEQLDKTLLNKSMMLTNKNKKVVKGSEKDNSSIDNNNSNKNVFMNANVNSKQKDFYTSYNSHLVENANMNQGENKHQRNERYDMYKKQNSFGNSNLLHMSSDIYDSNSIH